MLINRSMETQINDKQKIFVRYRPGASGHFVSLMILSLTKGVKLRNKFSGHENLSDIHSNHNLENVLTSNFDGRDLFEQITYARRTFEFYPTDNEYYIAHTHAINPDPLMLAFENTKLVNIVHQEEDKFQLAFNWVIKSAKVYGNQWDIVDTRLGFIKQNYKKLNSVPLRSADKCNTKLLTYICAIGAIDKSKQFIEYPFDSSYKDKVFTLQFADIQNKKIIAQLDALIDFLGIAVSEERKLSTIQMIHEYAESQIKVPWEMDINTFT
jgi:hypothetical protein